VRERFEHEAGYGFEDGVVGDERDSDPDCGRGDPAVSVVLALGECMADRDTIRAQLCTYRYELRASVYDLRALDLCVELQHPRGPPASAERAIAQLRDRLEGDECRPARDDRRVALSQPRCRDQISAEDIGVDDDRAARRVRGHDWTAARKASPSSSLRSSITISAWSGSARAAKQLLDRKLQIMGFAVVHGIGCHST